MIGKTFAVAAALSPIGPGPCANQPRRRNAAQGMTSGPAAGSPTSMRSPQAGSLEAKHQRKAVREQSQSVRSKNRQTARHYNDKTGATGSSSPPYAPPPR